MATDDYAVDLLRGYPRLAGIVTQLNQFLIQNHPNTFGSRQSHPVLRAKRSKVIHDNLWGTVRFTWRELALIDSPIIQRLRDIHQTGLAFNVYPSARHTRFEHSLGAVTIASRVFDALLHRQRNEVRDVVKVLWRDTDQDLSILRLKQELRLAALLHDTGHSLYSHTSELVYEKLSPLADASKELSLFVGKQKGAGEVLSFCFALTPVVAQLLARTEVKGLIGDSASDDYEGAIDLKNVALIIVGRSSHPFLQFLGDIVSSAFDADKLDYLLRDATNAGLPLRYDLDRYLYDVRIGREVLPDDAGELERLYSQLNASVLERKSPNAQTRYPYYETYRLRLSRRAMNVIEQIIICKMMLFSYIYHHPKARAADGLAERLLRRMVANWRANGESDEQILARFLKMTDASLQIERGEGDDDVTMDYRYRLTNRLLPREVYSISGPSATHAQGALIQDFLINLHDKGQREALIGKLEESIGSELIRLNAKLGTSPLEAAARAGIWVDAPKPPKFEDVDEMIMGARSAVGVPLAQLFPIREWTQAYEHYRYQVRIFAFSEFFESATAAARMPCRRY
jgi:HD superfamily phosphohydrolase